MFDSAISIAVTYTDLWPSVTCDVCVRVVFVAPSTNWLSHVRPDGAILAHLTVRRCVARRRIRRGGDLQGAVICRRCNAKAVNLAGAELRCGEIGAVIVSAEISEAVKCGAPSHIRRAILRTPPSPAGYRPALARTHRRAFALCRHIAGWTCITIGFALCCHSNATRAPIANPPNSAQLGSFPTTPPSYIRVRANSVGIRPRTDTQTDRHTQTNARDHDTFCVVNA